MCHDLLFESLWNLCLAKDCYQKWPEMLSWLSPCNASRGIFCQKKWMPRHNWDNFICQEEEAKAGRSVRPRSQEMQKSETNLEVVRDPGVSLRFCFLVSSHTTCCETIIVCWEIWSFQREMHPRAEDSIAYGHPRSSKQCWEAGNKPSLLEGVAERAWTCNIYFHVCMFSLYLHVAKQNSRSNLEMPPCEDVLKLNTYQIVHCKSLPCWIVLSFLEEFVGSSKVFQHPFSMARVPRSRRASPQDKSGGPRRPRDVHSKFLSEKIWERCVLCWGIWSILSKNDLISYVICRISGNLE